MIRKALTSDIKEIMIIVNETIVEMHSYNNYQWDENYPKEADFLRDITNKSLFIYESHNLVIGFICINKEEPNEYQGLNWSSQSEAYIVHRLAVKMSSRCSGIGSQLLKYADIVSKENNITNLKTDTYMLNIKTQGLFEKCGYKFVGDIRFLGKERAFYCYEKLL